MLSDIYSAEKQLTRALAKLSRAASDPQRSDAFKTRLEETQGRVERIDQVGEVSGIKLKRMKCVAMEGLIEEGVFDQSRSVPGVPSRGTEKRPASRTLRRSRKQRPTRTGRPSPTRQSCASLRGASLRGACLTRSAALPACTEADPSTRPDETHHRRATKASWRGSAMAVLHPGTPISARGLRGTGDAPVKVRPKRGRASAPARNVSRGFTFSMEHRWTST
jgi:hypothetical protein